MKIEKSNIFINENFKPILVKELAKNYPQMDVMDSPEKIVQIVISAISVVTIYRSIIAKNLLRYYVYDIITNYYL